MQIVRCPRGDGGDCTIPDRAVVISEEGVSLVRSDLVARLIDASDGPRRLRPFELSVSYERLVEDVQQSLMGETEPPLDSVRSLRSVVGGSTGSVVVLCSCGDRFIADF